MEDKSYRGMLVEVIVKSFTEDHTFDSIDILKKGLQDKLNLNLKFEAKVSDIESKDGKTFGKVFFDERCIDFVVFNTGVIDNNYTIVR